MVIIHGKRRREHAFARLPRYALYVLNFVFALHLALVSYYMSTFMVERGFPQDFIGLLYAAGSMLTLVSVAYAPQILQRFGNYANLLSLGLLELLAFVGFVFIHNPILLSLLLLISFIIPALVAFSLDIFLEGYNRSDDDTSGVRGAFLTISGVAWIAAPLIGGLIVSGEHFERLFAVSALVFVPFIFIAASQLEHFRDPKYIKLNIPKFMRTLTRDKNIRGIFASSFLLRFFYGIMVIYLPLYLHEVLGIPLASIGVILAFAMTAFVLIEAPIGRLEDRYWGEKEVLILGFAAISITTGLLSFVHTTSIALWAVMLFATRIGAAMIEVSSEGYFFKHVDARDTDDVSAFRMLYPLAYIVSALFGTVLLLFVPMQYVFFAAALVLLMGVLFVAPLKDTK